jgi:pilus assembly protein Flp/PilA
MKRSEIGPFVLRFMRSTSGATAIEYAMIAGGISMMVVGGVALIGTKVSGFFTSAAAGF